MSEQKHKPVTRKQAIKHLHIHPKRHKKTKSAKLLNLKKRKFKESMIKPYSDSDFLKALELGLNLDNYNDYLTFYDIGKYERDI